MRDTAWTPPSQAWVAPRCDPDEVRPVAWQEPCLARHVLAVQTAPRPRGSILERTLASLGRWEGPRILVSDGYEPRVPGWPAEASARQEGSSATFRRLLQRSVDEWPDLEWLTCCQDDVVVVRNFFRYLSVVKIPEDAGWVSWFSEMWGEKGGPFFGIYNPRRRFYDSQLVTLSRRTVDVLLHCWAWARIHGCDLFLNRAQCPFAVHSPSLADHVGGLNSACEHESLGERRSPSFPGEQFDALTLKGA